MTTRPASRPTSWPTSPPGAPAAALLALVLLAGCGARGGGDDTAATPPRPEPGVGACAADDPVVRDARSLVRLDLDGDGRADQVRTTAPDAATCPSVVFARTGAGVLATPAPEGPPVSAASAARLPGARADLLVLEQRHPRGGTQTRVYAATADGLAELVDADGNAVVPFVATDTPPAPVSVTCTPEGLVVTEAVAHEPPGVIFAWDVRRTTYAVRDGRAERTAREEVADNVLPARLAERFPDLVGDDVLRGCRA